VIELADLGFEPVTLIEEMGDSPRAGIALFCGVSYRFRPAMVPASVPLRGVWCDLLPVDSAQGLPVVADGEFRPRRSEDANGREFEVRWTSIGSPGLSTHPKIRELLADFFRRLVAGTATGAHWDVFIVEHYLDPVAEEGRSACAAMLGGRGVDGILEEVERDRLLGWARRLQGAV
jgi:hypothetical protein